MDKIDTAKKSALHKNCIRGTVLMIPLTRNSPNIGRLCVNGNRANGNRVTWGLGVILLESFHQKLMEVIDNSHMVIHNVIWFDIEGHFWKEGSSEGSKQNIRKGKKMPTGHFLCRKLFPILLYQCVCYARLFWPGGTTVHTLRQ